MNNFGLLGFAAAGNNVSETELVIPASRGARLRVVHGQRPHRLLRGRGLSHEGRRLRQEGEGALAVQIGGQEGDHSESKHVSRFLQVKLI